MSSAIADANQVHRFEVATDDPQEAVEIVRSIYADTKMKISGEESTFFYRQRSVSVGPLAVDDVTSPIGVDMQSPSFDFLCFITAGRAQASIHTRDLHVDMIAGDTVVAPTGQVHSSFARDLDTVVMRLPIAPVAARVGLDPRRFRFTAMTPMTPALGRYFRAAMQHIHAQVQQPDTALAHPLVLAGAIDMIAGAALATFPYACGQSSRSGAQAAAVRRAVAFMEANPARPLTMADIAAAAGISVRALQQGFQRQLDTTPLLYLRRVRLSHVHEDLQAADPANGDEVSSIARRWGFGHLGRFAAYYRAAYGLSPRHTLRR
ncbi:AraC family transcriptional regulator [Krasilnikovia sp. MM14-A1259]|uniref:AraC family transcriptional regulator n=1 Tax=Krasilnikovia sp. MM14-A1259 TaxID=3373539 RepID=UPI00399D2669